MAARFWVGGTGTWDNSLSINWSTTSGGLPGATSPTASDTVTFDGSSGGGIVTVNADISVTSITMGAFTGTLDFAANNNNPTMQTFSSSGSGVRTLNMGSGTWTLSGNNATIWNIGTITNLTIVRTPNPIICNYSGATGTRTIVHTNTGETTCPSFSVTAGTDTITLNATRVLDLNLTGFSGTLGTGTFVCYGSLTLSATTTVTATGNAISFANTSGTKTITSNGVTIDRPITLIGAGGTVQLGGNMTLGASRVFTLSNGAFDANNFNVAVGLFSSANSNTRTINMGSGTWTLSGVGTVWNTGTSSNLTQNAGTSTILISDTSASAKTLQNGTLGNSNVFNNLTITGGGSAGSVNISGNNKTVNNFTVTAGPANLAFTINLTTTILGTVTMVGSSGNLITIQSGVAGSKFTLSKSSGAVISDYLSLKDSNAIGGASWYAGANSTNVSNNNGWQFSAPDASKANFFGVL